MESSSIRYQCPETGQPLRPATQAELEQWNQWLARESSPTAHWPGQLQPPLTAAYLTVDGRRLYPVNKGIPLLLAPCGLEQNSRQSATV